MNNEKALDALKDEARVKAERLNEHHSMQGRATAESILANNPNFKTIYEALSRSTIEDAINFLEDHRYYFVDDILPALKARLPK